MKLSISHYLDGEGIGRISAFCQGMPMSDRERDLPSALRRIAPHVKDLTHWDGVNNVEENLLVYLARVIEETAAAYAGEKLAKMRRAK